MIGATVITAKVWQQIPEASRPAVAKAATEAGRLNDIRIRGFEQESIEVMQSYGLTVHPLDQDLRRQWERRSQAAYPVLLDGLVPRELIAKAERLLAEYRASAGAN
jgi:TRAP-type C4-dicarboxylate transport system substrate-binding protein